MPCLHRNINDLNLSYVTWKPKTLFIGTFNPGWNCPNNYSNWFYGRTQRNEFWCILPTIHNSASLLNGNRASWIQFCMQEDLAITDIITTIHDADANTSNHVDLICKNFKDEAIAQNFTQFTFTDIPTHLARYPSIQQVCVTRQEITGVWLTALAPTILHCNQNNIPFRPLRSPSRGARKGVTGPFCQYIANHWLTIGGYQP